ncbi:MAG: primosomal protein N', partial [Bacteroidota bacterium]|nr:primosomal protein N' [Bacteroidota bacterium]
QLQKKTGVKNISSILAGLESSGIITIAEQFKRQNAKPKLVKFVVKKEAPGDIAAKGKQQQKLLLRLHELGNEPYPVRQLLKEAHVSLATLNSLVKKSFVEIILREEPRREEFSDDGSVTPVEQFQLSRDQQHALSEISHAISEGTHKTFLLHGITGSGKTQVYIEAISEILARGKTAIVLVPEISLTPQIVRRFRLHFGSDVIVMHSRMAVGERYDAWRLAREGKYKIAVGPRSAIFAPLNNLGLIVVDEEHEASYKQFDATPRYNARDVAIVRGTQNNAVVLLGSATPSVESYCNAQSGKYALLELPERIDNAELPSIAIVSMAEEHQRVYEEMKLRAKEIGKKAFENGFHSLSKSLEEKIRERLNKKEGIILLQNRRGFAPFLECLECGYVARCEQCDVTMTYHLTKKHLRCHYCGTVKPVPDACPNCHGFLLKLQGFGTQRVEQELTALFPEAKILRMDLDTTTRKGSHDRLLQKFSRSEADILLGTQMVAKGLDFPRVTLVGVISADTQMSLPDFRSAERTFQLLTQVSGRAGRSALRGEVIIQSFQTSHYSLKHTAAHNFSGFYEEELQYRRQALYPPFARIVLVEVKGENEKRTEGTIQRFAALLKRKKTHSILLGPTAAVISRIKNQYRWHLIVKARRDFDPNGSHMRAAIIAANRELEKEIPRGVKIIIDVDPQGIM